MLWDCKRGAGLLLILSCLAICSGLEGDTGAGTKMSTPVPTHASLSKTVQITTVSPNCTNGTCTDTSAKGPGYISSINNYVSDNKDMLLRTFYVLIGVTGIIVVYFVVRTIRIRRRRSRTKRYGLLSTKDDQLEMAPLDIDDDEDDLTVFDINHPK